MIVMLVIIIIEVATINYINELNPEPFDLFHGFGFMFYFIEDMLIVVSILECWLCFG